MNNLNVLNKQKGEIILSRRLDREEKFNTTNFGPCPNCFTWMKKETIDRHQSVCPDRTANLSKSDLLLKSNIISGRISTTASKSHDTGGILNYAS